MELKFSTEYKGKTYTFDFGAKAYIFHTGIYNNVPNKRLLQYTEFVFNCYIEDNDRTSLGLLADYIAKSWHKVKNVSRRKVLENFYLEVF